MDQQTIKSTNLADDEISVKELILKIKRAWAYLLSKWVIILAVGLGGGVMGIIYGFYQKNVYVANLSFALEEDRSSGMGGALGLASQFGISLGGSDGGSMFSGDNLMELMKSRSIVERALLMPVNVNGKQQSLVELYLSFNDLRKSWKSNPQLANIQFLPNADRLKFTLQQDSILGNIYKNILKYNLTVDRVDKKLSITTISVSSENEIFSKYFCEQLAKTVSDFYVDARTKKSAQNVMVLQRQTDSVRRVLNAAINGVASSTDVNPNANPLLQVLKVPSQRRQVDVQANQAILMQLVSNLEIAKMSLRRETPLIQVIDSPVLPLDKTRFGKVKGLVIGGILGILLAVCALLLRKMFITIMNS